MRNYNLPLLSLLELINENASFVSPGKLAPFRELVNKRRFYILFRLLAEAFVKTVIRV